MKITLSSILVCISLLGVSHVQGMEMSVQGIEMPAGASASSEFFEDLTPLVNIDLGLHSYDAQVQEGNANPDQVLPIVIETLPEEEAAQESEKLACSVKPIKIIKRKTSADLTPPPAKRRHVVKLTAIKEHVCKYCDKIFTYSSLLQRHVRIHTGKKPFVCDYNDCGRRFAKKGNLTEHMRMHMGEKPFSCDDCGKGFARKGNLTAHMRMHTGERSFPCSEAGCTYTARRQGDLTKHIYTHTGEKPFACGDCDKRFAQKSNLTKHIYTHTGEKPCACPEAGCGYAAALKKTLKCHLKAKHGITE